MAAILSQNQDGKRFLGCVAKKRRRVRITERSPSQFFIPQPPSNAGFSPARERSVTLQRDVRRLGMQLEGFKINTDLERHQRAAKRRVKKGQYEE